MTVVGTDEHHPTTRFWAFPPRDRPPLGDGLERINLREIAAHPDRFEHHLLPCATIGAHQLEVATASEPLYFGHVNISDEYSLMLPTGDALVDGFPLRTFLSDPASGVDVARYNHRSGDLVLHPLGRLHWPGKLRPPYQVFEMAPGMRRATLSVVYCATAPTPSTAPMVPVAPERGDDAKAYATPAPPMVLTALRDRSGTVAAIGATALDLVLRPTRIAPDRGGWIVVLEAPPASTHVAGDLIRIPPGSTLDGSGIDRALIFASATAAPDPVPPAWREMPAPPFDVFEDRPRGELPIQIADLTITEVSAATVRVTVRRATVEVPRYWLARTLFRVALHRLRLGLVVTYGGMFFDDHAATTDDAHIGVRTADATREAIVLSRTDAMSAIERMYRAVAPPGYVERLA